MISPIREELDAVLRDPVFARSPALSRLLAYLVDASARGEGARLKSYTVAVEGLGKTADFDPQVNTSARVLVARLRRALDTYYAGAGAQRPVRLAIKSGSYEVRLEDNQHYFAEQRAREAVLPAGPERQTTGRGWPKLAALALIVAAAGLAALWLRPAADTAPWGPDRFPYVLLQLEDDGTPLAHRYIEPIRNASIEEFGRYEVVRPAYERNKTLNYSIKLRTESAGNGISVDIEVADLGINKIIYSDELKFANRQDFEQNGDHRLFETYFNLLGYRGVIVSQERKRVRLDEGAYGCWLRFSADALSDGGFGDDELNACAARWHARQPDHPVATAIYAWTQVNGTVGDLSERSRKATLHATAAMLERARTLAPNSRHVLLSLARTYAFMGDNEALQGVAAELEERDRYNLDILSAVGTFLVLQNNMHGTELIDHAISHNVDPPGRYFIGKFFAAMMNEDLEGAGAAIMRINTQGHASLLSQVLRAAYEGRMGHIDAARASWEQATEQKPVLRLYPAAFLSSLPASPPVRDRLRKWLRPVAPEI